MIPFLEISHKNIVKTWLLRIIFDHVNLKGEDPTARGLESSYRCYKDYGSYYTDGIAENIFQNNLYNSVTYYNGIPIYDWNTLEEIAQSTVKGWMNSPGHRKNILTPNSAHFTYHPYLFQVFL